MLLKDIAQLLLSGIKQQSVMLLAIDGRCAAGKTSLAAHIAGGDCNIIHLDHFFLRPKQRTAERLQQAGGNVDYGRFLEEVLISLHSWVFSHKRVLRMERPIPSILWRRISGEGIR